jgi:hypothetical protein
LFDLQSPFHFLELLTFDVTVEPSDVS